MNKFLTNLDIAEESMHNYDISKRNIIFPNSVTYFGYSREVFWELARNKTSTANLRFFQTQNFNVFFARWNNTRNKFEVYSHVISWHDLPEKINLENIIPEVSQKKCKKKPMKISKIGTMSGSRDMSD